MEVNLCLQYRFKYARKWPDSFFHFSNGYTEWPPIGKIAAHSAYDMFSLYKYLIVSLVFSHLGFWSGNLFLIAPFPDLCLLVLFFFCHTKFYVWKKLPKLQRASTCTYYTEELSYHCWFCPAKTKMQLSVS